MSTEAVGEEGFPLSNLTDLQAMAIAVLRDGASAAQPFLDALTEKLQLPEIVHYTQYAPIKDTITVPFGQLRVVVTLTVPDAYFDVQETKRRIDAWLTKGEPLLLSGCRLEIYQVPDHWDKTVADHWKAVKNREEKALADIEPLEVPVPDFSDRAPDRRIGGTPGERCYDAQRVVNERLLPEGEPHVNTPDGAVVTMDGLRVEPGIVHRDEAPITLTEEDLISRGYDIVDEEDIYQSIGTGTSVVDIAFENIPYAEELDDERRQGDGGLTMVHELEGGDEAEEHRSP